MKVHDIAVIGGGAAGTMALLRGVLNNDHCLFFPGSPKHNKKSRAFWVSKIENMPGFQKYGKGIMEPVRETLKWIEESEFSSNLSWMKNRGIEVLEKNKEGIFELTDSKGDQYQARYVVLATGIMDVQPKIQGEIKTVFPYANKQSIDYCLRCDGHHVFQKPTGVIGHGPGAAWVSIMLYERYGGQYSIFTNGESPQWSEEADKLLKLYGMKVFQSPILEVKGERREGRLEGFLLESQEEIQLEIAFVSLGTLVYNDLAIQLGAQVDERGYVLSNEQGETNIEGLYVAGDLRANAMKQVYTAWNHGVLSMDDINLRLRLEKRKKIL